MNRSYSVSIRIRHPHADPAELTRHIGLRPQHCWKAGDTRSVVAEGASAGTYRETYWIAELPLSLPTGESGAAAANLPLENMLALAAHQFERRLPLENVLALAMYQFDRCPSFWRRFIAEGGNAEFLVEIHGRDGFSLELSHDTVSKMARLGMAISVSIDSQLQAVA